MAEDGLVINGIEILFASDPREARMRCMAFLEWLSTTASGPGDSQSQNQNHDHDSVGVHDAH